MSGIVYADSIKPDFGLPYPRYTVEELEKKTTEELQTMVRAKILAEQNAKIDPISFGWTLEGWREVMENWQKYRAHCILGGNRSSKSSFAASLVVHMAQMIPEAKIRCYHVNEEKSVAEQQSLVWAALPQAYKNLARKKGLNYSIQYNQKNGFTSSKLILPPHPGYSRGSEILFCNYQQYKNDPQTAEGWWAHLIWGDEEMPQKLFETLLYRLIDARGRIVLTFTTLNGWTPLVADILGRKKTLKTIISPILGRPVPVAEESISRPSTRIYYFQTADNVFVPADDFLTSLKGRPAEEILARAHGVPTKTAVSPLPKFDEAIHVIAHEKLPWLSVHKTADGKELPPSRVTLYHVVDPAPNKCWYQLWVAVDPKGVVYVYREMPDISEGEWAEFSNEPGGKNGPAQRPNGWGFQDYAREIRKVEEDEEIYERFMDPRMGETKTMTLDGSESILSGMDEQGMSFKPANGDPIKHGLSLINDYLAFDETKPVGPLNSPRLFISDRCQNLIWAMKNYTDLGGKNEACKDPIDCLRYLLTTGIDYVDEAATEPLGRTFSY